LNQYRTVNPWESSLSQAAPGIHETADVMTAQAKMKLIITEPEFVLRTVVAVTRSHKKTKNTSPGRHRLGYRRFSTRPSDSLRCRPR